MFFYFIGFTLFLPDIQHCLTAGLSETMLTVFPHLKNIETKKKVLEYFLFELTILFPVLYKNLLSISGTLLVTPELLKKFITTCKGEHSETFTVLLEQCLHCEKNLKNLAKVAVDCKKPQIACILTCKVGDCYDVLKKVAKRFSKDHLKAFSSNCSPKMRTGLIKAALFSREKNFGKRKSTINDVLQSGFVDTTSTINFIEALQQSMDFLLHDPNILQTLFQFGFSIEKSKGLRKLPSINEDQLTKLTSILHTLLEHGVDIDNLIITTGKKTIKGIELVLKTGVFKS